METPKKPTPRDKQMATKRCLLTRPRPRPRSTVNAFARRAGEIIAGNGPAPKAPETLPRSRDARTWRLCEAAVRALKPSRERYRPEILSRLPPDRGRIRVLALKHCD